MWIEREINMQIQEDIGARPCAILTGTRQAGWDAHKETVEELSLDSPIKQ